jgi:hypothetical protein
MAKPRIVSQYADRPAFDLSFDPRMEVGYGITHDWYVSISANIYQRQFFKKKEAGHSIRLVKKQGVTS